MPFVGQISCHLIKNFVFACDEKYFVIVFLFALAPNARSFVFFNVVFAFALTQKALQLLFLLFFSPFLKSMASEML